ncbi:MAG: hypothetical protein FJY29_13570 [Betaproteobacteria bacterium]|nr:hypothetical protein [Betaproteobacteria bacterium]
MKLTKTQAVRSSLGIAFALLLAACSFELDTSTIHAVEVGNPEDSRPLTPSLPKPLRLVQIELQTTDLEEIAQIDFAVQSVNLVLLSSSGKVVVVASNNLKPGSQLTLFPKSQKTLKFEVPGDALANNPQLKIQMKFVDAKPGSVKVDSQEFAIAPQAEPLHLPLPSAATAKVSGLALVIAKSVDKSSLFSSSASSEPRSGSVDPAKSPGTPQPTSTHAPVYKLKGS